jgi:hypothetical protein
VAWVAAGDLAQARGAFEAITDLPTHPDLLGQYGTLLWRLRETGAALKVFHAVLEVEPDSRVAAASIAHLLLIEGRYEQAWPWYAAQPGVATASNPGVPGRPWQGQSLDDACLRLWCRGGYGDMVLFARFVRVLKQRYAALRVEVVADAAAQALMRAVDGVDAVRPAAESMDDAAYQCSIMALPAHLNAGVAQISQAAYLRVAAAAAPRRSPAVGLVWASGADLGDPGGQSLKRLRDVPLAALRALLQTGGVDWVCLQKGDGLLELDAGNADLAGRMSRPDLPDLYATAALIAGLDLVLTVDTAVAHIAGALGKPVWIMAEFGFWTWYAGVGDSLWYPSARIYRQESPGDWQPVLARVQDGLRAWVRSRALPPPGA